MGKRTDHPNMIDGHSWDKEKVMSHICTTLASSSLGIASILEAGLDGAGLPTYTTIAKWLSEDPVLAEKYARSKADQCDYLADEMLYIADNTTDPQKARVQIDTRKWIASKLKPKKYGDKITQEHTGADGGAIQTELLVQLVSAPKREE